MIIHVHYIGTNEPQNPNGQRLKEGILATNIIIT